ncbi:unnamed protein product [Ectocarpus sp. 12 AP-2014]
MIHYEHVLHMGSLAKHGGVVEVRAGILYMHTFNLRYLVMIRLGPDVEAVLKNNRLVGGSQGWLRQTDAGPPARPAREMQDGVHRRQARKIHVRGAGLCR